MKIRCPKCQTEVDATKTVCPSCGASVSVGSLLSIYFGKVSAALTSVWHSLWGGHDKVFTAGCPRCGESIPFSVSECPLCKLPIRLSFLFAWYGEPLLRLLLRIRAFADTATPFQKWMVRFCYFVASAAALWLVLLKAEAKFEGHGGGWIVAALSTAIYVSISLVVLPWLIPRGTIRALSTIRPLAKLSLFLNYITLVLSVMIASDVWKVRSWLLLTTFLASLFGFYIFMNYVHPTWAMLGETLDPQPDWKKRNPNYRGRSADYRAGKWS